jgi:hypothetical protein
MRERGAAPLQSVCGLKGEPSPARTIIQLEPSNAEGLMVGPYTMRNFAMRKMSGVLLTAVLALGLATPPARADLFGFSTGNPDGLIAVGSRPSSSGKIEIEAGDDFILNGATRITQASFTGLLPTGLPLSQIGNVRVEIYRVFPNDSVVPPSGHVLSRVNSPSDVAFAERDVATSTLSFNTTVLNSSFTAANSVLNGIHPFPNQTTHGEGSVVGQEVRFDVTLTSPLGLPADHYFFVPQVEITGGVNAGEFLWLSAPKPIVSPGTPFVGDLQTWIRDDNLAPDWSRVGTDIIGGTPAPQFNMTFSLTGESVPEPNAFALSAMGGSLLFGLAYRRKRRTETL